MPETASALLRNVVSLTQVAISRRVAAGSPPAMAMQRLRRALEQPVAQPQPPAPRTLPACEHLGAALAASPPVAPDLVELSAALGALAPQLAWRHKPSDNAHFTQGHANVDLVGPQAGALEQRGDAWIGLSLMAPHTTYPDHHHAPEEVYLVLTDGDWRQAAGPWHAPGIGGIVYNPPDIIHAMRSHGGPLLAIWCLPLG